MFKRLIAIAASLFAALALFADEVEFAAAKEFAHAWRGRAVKGGRTHWDGAGASRFHVVSFEGGGWAAVGVDDEEAPIIAFSDDGEDLVEDDKNPVWFLVKRDAERRAKGREISHKEHKGHKGRHKGWERKRKGEGRGSVKSATATAKTAVSDSALEDIRVAPLLKSTWDQKTAGGYYTYNYYTPNHYYCGCVATMMAQMMRYFEWPRTSVTERTYLCKVGTNINIASTMIQTNCTMMGGVYDWTKMDLCPNELTPYENRQVIGKLCYDCGVAVSMSWSGKGSGAFTSLVREAFVDTFEYTDAQLVVFNYPTEEYPDPIHPYDGEELKTIVISNCEAGLPIGYGISGSSAGGHAVVIDGYGYSGDGEFYIHINPGWSGSSNAWYNPPNLAMGGYAFDSSDELVYNVFTNGIGQLVTGKVIDLSGRPIAGAVLGGYVTYSGVRKQIASVKTDKRGSFAIKTGVADRAVTLHATATFGSVQATQDISLPAQSTMRGYRDAPFSGSYYPRPYSLGNKYDFNFTLPCHTTAPKVLFR